jgi:hypothetical protein
VFVTIRSSGAVFTTPRFLRNLRLGPIGLNVLKCQAFLLNCNLTRWNIVLILKLQRKYSFVNTVPRAVFTTPRFLRNLQLGPIGLKAKYFYSTII